MTFSLDQPIEAFVTALRAAGASRAAFVRTAGGELASPEGALGDLARAIRAEPDFDDHEALFLAVGRDTGSLHTAVLHRTVRGQGAGGVRHWPYGSLRDCLRDGLRLSRGMGRKNALAGLWWGGGKGVIARRPGDGFRDALFRQTLYREYGTFVTSLRGLYVTAEDVGTTPPDMAEIFTRTRFTTCIPEAQGGSGNPSPATALGVVCAMEAALAHLGQGTLTGKRVAMQGCGNVGRAMVGELLQRGVAGIVVAEIAAEHAEATRALYPGAAVTVRTVAAGDDSIVEEPADVFAPNALGAILSPRTIPRLACRIVCGAANNQLEDEARDSVALAARGITYVPDFVANRMGIVSCANEQYGSFPSDPSIQRHLGTTDPNSIHVITRRILEDAAARGSTSTAAANALADALAREPHPIFPHRGRDITRALLDLHWERGPAV